MPAHDPDLHYLPEYEPGELIRECYGCSGRNFLVYPCPSYQHIECTEPCPLCESSSRGMFVIHTVSPDGTRVQEHSYMESRFEIAMRRAISDAAVIAAAKCQRPEDKPKWVRVVYRPLMEPAHHERVVYEVEAACPA